MHQLQNVTLSRYLSLSMISEIVSGLNNIFFPRFLARRFANQRYVPFLNIGICNRGLKLLQEYDC